MDDKQQRKEEKRIARRKRRVRNQVMAYLAVIVLILALAGGIVIAVRQFTSESERQQEAQESSQEKIEEILAEEEDIEVPTPTPEPPVEMTPEQKLDDIAMAGIEVMPLEDKVAGLFIVTPEDLTGVATAVQAGDGTKDALSQYAVGGLIYFDKNIESEEQVKEMLRNTASYAKYPLFLAVDEEGGSVSRVAEAGIGEKVDSAQKIGQTGLSNNAYEAGVTIGTSLSSLGFNLDFAPVADLASVDNSVMEGRAYGSDAELVAPYVTSMMRGLQEQNVASCLKHFPGNGATAQDSHTGPAVSERTAEEFRSEEFAVFRAGIESGADMIMVGHMVAPALTEDGDRTPSSLSDRIVTDILREELGYDGVIITDALNMSAITDYYTADEAAIQALKAGCDMLLMPEDFRTAYYGVLQAVRDGVISEERINDSLLRIYRIKYADRVEE